MIVSAIFNASFPKHALGMRGSDIHMIENVVYLLAAAAARAGCLRQAFQCFCNLPVKTSRKIDTFETLEGPGQLMPT